MTTLTMVRGDSKDVRFTVLQDPTIVAGTWTWDATTTVLTGDTSGVSVGDWIRRTSSDSLFKISVVNANVDVTIENPNTLTIPSGVGVEAALPLDLTGGVVKFSVKEFTDQANADAVVFKASYVDPDDVEITDAVAGEGTVHVCAQDTDGKPPGTHAWDLETTRQGVSVAVAGTLAIVEGSSIVTLSAVADQGLAKVGDVIVPVGANTDVFTVTATPSTSTALAAAELLTDYPSANFTTDAAAVFTLFRGDRKTPDGLRGSFVLQADATL